MEAPHEEKEEFRLKPYLIEIAIYSVLMFAYFFLVLHFLGGWLKELFDHYRWTYAFAGLAIMIGQAVGLEYVTRMLLRMARARTR